MANFGLIHLATGANLFKVTAATEVLEHVALLVVGDPVGHSLHFSHGLFLRVDCTRATASLFGVENCAIDLSGRGCLDSVLMQIDVIAEVLDGQNLVVLVSL